MPAEKPSPQPRRKQKSVIPVYVVRDDAGTITGIRAPSANLAANDELLNDVAVCEAFPVTDGQFHYRQAVKDSGGWASLDGERLTRFERAIQTGRGRRIVFHYLRSEVVVAVYGRQASRGIYHNPDGTTLYNVTAVMRRLNCANDRLHNLEDAGILNFRERTSPASYQTERICSEADVQNAERVIEQNRKTRRGKQLDRRKFNGDWYISTESAAAKLKVHRQTLTKYGGALVYGEKRIDQKKSGRKLWWHEHQTNAIAEKLQRAREQSVPDGWQHTCDLLRDAGYDTQNAREMRRLGKKLKDARESGELEQGSDWWQCPAVSMGTGRDGWRNPPTHWNPSTVLPWLTGKPAPEQPAPDSPADPPAGTPDDTTHKAKAGRRSVWDNLLKVYDRMTEENEQKPEKERLTERQLRKQAVATYNKQYAGRGDNPRATPPNLKGALKYRREKCGENAAKKREK